MAANLNPGAYSKVKSLVRRGEECSGLRGRKGLAAEMRWLTKRPAGHAETLASSHASRLEPPP